MRINKTLWKNDGNYETSTFFNNITLWIIHYNLKDHSITHIKLLSESFFAQLALIVCKLIFA